MLLCPAAAAAGAPHVAVSCCPLPCRPRGLPFSLCFAAAAVAAPAALLRPSPSCQRPRPPHANQPCTSLEAEHAPSLPPLLPPPPHLIQSHGGAAGPQPLCPTRFPFHDPPLARPAHPLLACHPGARPLCCKRWRVDYRRLGCVGSVRGQGRLLVARRERAGAAERGPSGRGEREAGAGEESALRRARLPVAAAR